MMVSTGALYLIFHDFFFRYWPRPAPQLAALFGLVPKLLKLTSSAEAEGLLERVLDVE